jgi:hypothetical protein
MKRALLILGMLYGGGAIAATGSESSRRDDVLVKAREYRAHFEGQRDRIVGGAGRTKTAGFDAGMFGALGMGGSGNIGIVMATERGKRQLRLPVAFGTSGEGVGLGLRFGVVSREGDEPDQRGAGAGALVLGFERHEWNTGSANFGILGIGILDGDEKRTEVSIPLSFKWDSAELRRARRGMKLSDKAHRLVEEGKIEQAQKLIDRLAEMKASDQ